MNDNQRIENFNTIKNRLEGEGYSAEKHTISILKANIMAFITAGPLALLCWIVFFYFHRVGAFELTVERMLLFYVLLIAGIFVHEYLHGLTWQFFCEKGWKSIHMGVMWKKLTPYCCCMEPLRFQQYLPGVLMPLIVLGIGTFAIALATGSIFWLMLSIINIVGAGGDTTIVFMLMKHKNALIVDDPTECGYCAFSKEQL